MFIFEIISLFLLLLILIILAASSALLVKFIDQCFNEGNILEWYYKLLLQIELKSKPLSKVLGLCPKCFGFWLSTFLFIVYKHYFDFMLIFYIPYISFAEYFISLLFKEEDENTKQILND